jgi:hypothetical protein
MLDPEAGFTRRGQRSFFGFKAHLAVDLGSDLVRGAILTGADIGDSLAADALVQGDEDAVFADEAYDSAALPARERRSYTTWRDTILDEPRPKWGALRGYCLSPDVASQNKRVRSTRQEVDT